MNTGNFLTIPADEYHAASRSGQYMSSHLLADFRESPELYRRKTNGEIAELLGISKRTVENHLNLVLKELRKITGIIAIFF